MRSRIERGPNTCQARPPQPKIAFNKRTFKGKLSAQVHLLWDQFVPRERPARLSRTQSYFPALMTPVLVLSRAHLPTPKRTFT